VPVDVNLGVAARLDEVAQLLEDQGANPYRVRAYRRAASLLRGLDRPVSDLLHAGGTQALTALPGVGDSLARSIRDILLTGRLPMLARLRGEADPMDLLRSVPGVGERTAQRLHHELGLDTLEDLEAAAHDGRLASLLGIGPKRLAGLRAALAHRLARVRRALSAPPEEPPVAELLDVDGEYRDKGASGLLRTIAPRRLNPEQRAWLPVLHTERGARHYTALFSNTPRAHRLDATRDWVILYVDAGHHERQYTVVTARLGPLAGRRVVRGRETECAAFYQEGPADDDAPERTIHEQDPAHR
jgi:hypothetical protein